MNEHQRMQYLDAMGIDMFVPRLRLVQAKVSQALVVPAHQEAGAPGTAQTLAENDTVQTATNGTKPVEVAIRESSARNLVSNLSEVSSRSANDQGAQAVIEQDSPAAAAAEQKVGDDEAVSFSLELWHFPDLLVIDSHIPGSGYPTAALLFYMLRAANRAGDRPPGSEILNWPPFDIPHKPKHLGAAREMMLPLLEHKLQQGVELLIFGEAAFNVLTEQSLLKEGFKSRCYHKIDLQAGASKALLLPSLVEVLREPARKAHIWRALYEHGIVRSE